MQTTIYAGSRTFQIGDRVGSGFGPATITGQHRRSGGMVTEITTDTGRVWVGLPHHCTFGLSLVAA